MNFSFKSLKMAGIIATLAGLLFLVVIAYYYGATNPETILISCDAIPSGIPAQFTPDAVTDRVAGHLDDMVVTADSQTAIAANEQEGLVPVPVRPPAIIDLASVPSPVFNQKWKGLTLDLARGLGTSLRAKTFVEIELIGQAPGGWRLVAYEKKRPHFSPVLAGSAPRSGGVCIDLESCANDLGEQVLGILDYRRLLTYYIKLDTPIANQRILELFERKIPKDKMTSSYYVVWGNAFYNIQRYDDALVEYQNALRVDTNSLSGHVARGLVYYTRPHGHQALDDVQLAERDFRWAVEHEPTSEVAQTNLCNVLITKWAHDSTHPIKVLNDAKEHCTEALKANPQSAVAAVDIASITYRAGLHREALAHFEDLSQEFPTNSILLVNYGYFLYREYLTGDSSALEKAVEKTLKATELTPSNFIAANNLGYFYYEQGDYSKAVESWKKANVLNGNDADCLAGLALGLHKLGQTAEATALWARATRLDQNYANPSVLKENADWSDQAALDLASLITVARSSVTAK